MDFQRTNNQQLHMDSGLTRYRSAPSSYFSSFLDAADDAIRNQGGSGGGGGGGGCGDYGGDDFDSFVNRFMPSNSIRTQGQDSSSNNSFANNISMRSQSQFVASMKQEPDAVQSQPPPPQRNQSNYSPVSPMMHQKQVQAQAQAQAQAQTQQQNTNSEGSSASAVDNSYGLLNSARSNRLATMKMGNGGDNSNLIRYNSSPAGLFANINIENEYGAMRGMGSFGGGNNANAEASFSSSSRFHGHGHHMDFSSAQATHSGLMSPISEIGSSGMAETKPGNTSFGENQKNESNYMSGFQVTSWDDSSVLPDSFLKGLGDDLDDNKEAANRPPTLLSHHLSLPKTSDELSAMESLMQDSVLCKLRAKRGCATHPRSIAERVRRTRISERMRKLQDLVPNMDKQTNTADMLDLAVDYIKELQKQVQTLSDHRAKCTCLNQ